MLGSDPDSYSTFRGLSKAHQSFRPLKPAPLGCRLQEDRLTHQILWDVLHPRGLEGLQLQQVSLQLLVQAGGTSVTAQCLKDSLVLRK